MTEAEVRKIAREEIRRQAQQWQKALLKWAIENDIPISSKPFN